MDKEKQAAKEEILAGKKETATSIAMGGARPFFPLLLKSILKIRIMLIVFFLIAIVSVGALSYYKLFSGSTALQKTVSIVEGVQELATLATAEAVVTTVIKKEDNKIFNKDIAINLPGTKRTLLLIVPATVLAGVDLASITDDQIIVDEEKRTVNLSIPRATIIQEPSIQLDKVQTYSEEGLFRSEVSWDEGFNLAAEASEAIKQEAIELDLLVKAEESAEKILVNFFKQLGYTATIKFK